MNRIFDFLSKRRVLNVFILISYFLAVVAPHKRFGTFINKIVVSNGFTIQQYNFYILISAITVLVIYLLVFIINANKRFDRKKLYVYMFFNITLASLIINTLFVINIEMVHFPQYALLAILLFPLVGNYTATIIWGTLLGMVDEAYQYFYLAPLDTSYFDFNDVVTDIVGIVFGLLLLRSLNIKEHATFDIKRSTIWVGIALLITVVSTTHLMGVLSIYPNDARPYHILREWPKGFWTIYEWNSDTTIVFHTIRPLEGLIITMGLWTIYSKLRSDKEE